MISSRPHVGPPEAGTSVVGEDYARVDWWGAELEGVTFTRCRFDDAGLEELVTRRCVFDHCVLTGVRMGGARHTGTAFLSCRFDRATLFDDYSKGAGANPAKGGFGLGLASVRRLAAAMSGRAGLDARWTRGAAFWIELPAAHAPALDEDRRCAAA